MTFHFPDQIDVNLLTIDATIRSRARRSSRPPRYAWIRRTEPPRKRPRWSAARPGTKPPWISASSTPSRRPTSAPRSTRSSARRCRAGPAPIGSITAIPRTADTPRAPQRDQLLPTLHALHERAGWISPGALNYVARRLTIPPADVYGVATFYALFSRGAAAGPGAPRVQRPGLPRAPARGELIDTLTERIGPPGHRPRRRRVARRPVPGPVRPGAGGVARAVG